MVKGGWGVMAQLVAQHTGGWLLLKCMRCAEVWNCKAGNDRHAARMIREAAAHHCEDRDERDENRAITIERSR